MEKTFLILSTIAQIAAVVFVIWMVVATGRQKAWLLMGSAFVVMLLWRVLALVTLSRGVVILFQPSLNVAVSLIVSLLFLASMYFVRAAFVERERAMAALDASERRFANMASATPDMLFVYDVPESRFIYCNRSVENMLGLSPAQFQSMHGKAVGELVHPDDRPALQAVTARLKAAADGEMIEFEHRARHANGEYRWINLRMVIFHRMPDGRPRQFIGTCRDLTARKRAEQAVQIGRERLDIVLRGSALGMWYATLPFDTLEWDERVKEHFWLAAETKVTLETFRESLHPDDRQRVSDAMDRSIQSRELFDIEFRTVCSRTGGIKWIRSIARGYYDGDKPMRFDGITIDITQKKNAEQEREMLLASERAARAEAERANRLKDDFLSTVSHELRTPLNAIFGWSQLLRAKQSDDEDLNEGLAVIERNARVQTQIIEDLLDMSRIISGKMRLDVQPVDLAAVIRAAADSVRHAADAREIELLLHLNPLPETIEGDPNRLQQVIWNLLSNAIKFTVRGGRVQVTMGQTESHVEIIVTDNGDGIDPEFLPYMFERFRQADSTASRKHGGLGLGLSIVKHLVEMHGGSIRAESAGPGCGATFAVTLPIAPTQSERSAQHQGSSGYRMSRHAAEDQVNLAGICVLVIDDEPDAHELVRRLLEPCHARVIVAASAAEALEAVEQQPVGVILSDIGMPGMDGYEFIRTLRERGKTMPAAALSAFARSEDRRRAMLAGYQTHVAKPVEPSELIAVVANLAGRTGVERGMDVGATASA